MFLYVNKLVLSLIFNQILSKLRFQIKWQVLSSLFLANMSQKLVTEMVFLKKS
ncbi:hypothetical protein ABID22_001381 [Pontibacter aydingkolensis]